MSDLSLSFVSSVSHKAAGLQTSLIAQILFRSSAVTTAVKKSKNAVLKRQGAYVRGIARRAIRYRANVNTRSAPGSAPYTHGEKLLKWSIWFAVRHDAANVVIGPAANFVGTLGKLHEFGGVVRRFVPLRGFQRKTYQKGDVGPLSTRKYTDLASGRRRGGYSDPLGGDVAFVRLNTVKQAQHATRLAARLARKYGRWKPARYPARPFMRPSLEVARERLPTFWRNAIRGKGSGLRPLIV